MVTISDKLNSSLQKLNKLFYKHKENYKNVPNKTDIQLQDLQLDKVFLNDPELFDILSEIDEELNAK